MAQEPFRRFSKINFLHLLALTHCFLHVTKKSLPKIMLNLQLKSQKHTPYFMESFSSKLSNRGLIFLLLACKPMISHVHTEAVAVALNYRETLKRNESCIFSKHLHLYSFYKIN